MSRQKFDPSKVKTQFGKHFYEGQRLGSHRERLYQQWLRNQGGGSVKGRATFPKQYSKYFSSGTKFTTRQGHIAPWAKPMTLKGGSNPNYNWGRVSYINSKVWSVSPHPVVVGVLIPIRGKEAPVVQLQFLMEQSNG